MRSPKELWWRLPVILLLIYNPQRESRVVQGPEDGWRN